MIFPWLSFPPLPPSPARELFLSLIVPPPILSRCVTMALLAYPTAIDDTTIYFTAALPSHESVGCVVRTSDIRVPLATGSSG
jgi:hypothetical protein